MSKIERIATSPSERRYTVPGIEITVSTDLASCREEWIAMQEDAVTTVFQTFAWLDAWQFHVGVSTGVQPLIVTGRRPDGTIAFILPFGLKRQLQCRVLTWLSAPHNNYGFGIFDPKFIEQECYHFKHIWQHILSVLPKVDAIELNNQPEWCGDTVNPFLPFKTGQSANRSHVLHLTKDYQRLLNDKFSSRSRRRFRQQEKALKELGSWVKIRAQKDVEVLRAADAMFSQKGRQLELRGIASPFTDAFKDFFCAYATSALRGDASLRCIYMELNGRVVATNFGAIHNGTFYGLVTTMDQGRLDRFSPGMIAMNSAIEQSCYEGLEAFDFATGDAEYKHRWADQAVPMFETLIPYSFKGQLYCWAQGAATDAKRIVKDSPTLWRWAQSLRQTWSEWRSKIRFSR